MSMTLAAYAALVAGKKCRFDGAALPAKVDAYAHRGGWTVDGLAGKQWLSVQCPVCHYDWSLNKLGIAPTTGGEVMNGPMITQASVQRAQQELDDCAAVHGGHCEDDSIADVCLQVCAPAGKVWVASDGEHIVCATSYGPQQWLDDAVSDAMERIAQGTRDAEEE